jgi:hypothetical protein
VSSSVGLLARWNKWYPNLLGAPEQTIAQAIVADAAASATGVIFRIGHDKQALLFSVNSTQNNEHTSHVTLNRQRLKPPD